MRVVLDTNILISALISAGGWPDRLYQAWRTGQFDLISSEDRLLAVLATHLPKIDVSPDPADNFLLAMAQVGHADYLVTRDKDDLLALGRHKNTRIIPVSQMIEFLEK